MVARLRKGGAVNSALAPIGFALPRLIPCNHCNGSGRGRVTLACDVCDGLGGWQSVDWPLATLAHNLTIAGALCTAYSIGAVFCPCSSCDAWKPGCGKAWEGR